MRRQAEPWACLCTASERPGHNSPMALCHVMGCERARCAAGIVWTQAHSGRRYSMPTTTG